MGGCVWDEFVRTRTLNNVWEKIKNALYNEGETIGSSYGTRHSVLYHKVVTRFRFGRCASETGLTWKLFQVLRDIEEISDGSLHPSFSTSVERCFHRD